MHTRDRKHLRELSVNFPHVNIQRGHYDNNTYFYILHYGCILMMYILLINFPIYFQYSAIEKMHICMCTLTSLFSDSSTNVFSSFKQPLILSLLFLSINGFRTWNTRQTPLEIRNYDTGLHVFTNPRNDNTT